MSQTPSPAAPEQETHNGSLPASVVPWYRRPLFWGLLFFLGLLLLAVWLFWKEWQAAENLKGQIASETTALQKQNQARYTSTKTQPTQEQQELVFRLIEQFLQLYHFFCSFAV